MSATTKIEEVEKEEVKNDMDKVDNNKLAALKAKKANMEKEMAAKLVVKKERSIRFGVLGTGAGGSRLAESFYKLGYDSVVCNTASVDLKSINIPDTNKLLLDFSIGGASRDLQIGLDAAEANRDKLVELVNSKLGDSQANILCTSLGGGSGSGSVPTLVSVLAEQGKPIVVIAVLPADYEDAVTKSNSLETLARLSGMAQAKQIQNLIVVDNARIEAIYHGVSQLDFFPTANNAIVAPLDAFNTLSSVSAARALDAMEFAKIMFDGEGLTIYGELEVENFDEDTAIAEAIMSNLDSNLLASGFDLKQAKYIGLIIAGNENVNKKITNTAVSYALSMATDSTNAHATFSGVYVVDEPRDIVKVYFVFSGLGLPDSRVQSLKKDVEANQKVIKAKEEVRSLNLTLDTGKNESVSAAQDIRSKIAAKNSSFGKFVSSSKDRRS